MFKASLSEQLLRLRLRSAGSRVFQNLSSARFSILNNTQTGITIVITRRCRFRTHGLAGCSGQHARCAMVYQWRWVTLRPVYAITSSVAFQRAAHLSLYLHSAPTNKASARPKTLSLECCLTTEYHEKNFPPEVFGMDLAWERNRRIDHV